MRDLIDRENAMNEILLLMKDMKLTSGDTTVWQDCIISPTEAAHVLRWMPSADAVEVVRCRDCKYATEHDDTDGNVPYWTCSEWDSGTDYDGFCHYGERKEE